MIIYPSLKQSQPSNASENGPFNPKGKAFVVFQSSIFRGKLVVRFRESSFFRVVSVGWFLQIFTMEKCLEIKDVYTNVMGNSRSVTKCVPLNPLDVNKPSINQTFDMEISQNQRTSHWEKLIKFYDHSGNPCLPAATFSPGGKQKCREKGQCLCQSDIWTNFPKLCIVTCATIWRKIKWLLVGGFNNMLVKLDHGTPKVRGEHSKNIWVATNQIAFPTGWAIEPQVQRTRSIFFRRCSLVWGNLNLYAHLLFFLVFDVILYEFHIYFHTYDFTMKKIHGLFFPV